MKIDFLEAHFYGQFSLFQYKDKHTKSYMPFQYLTYENYFLKRYGILHIFEIVISWRIWYSYSFQHIFTLAVFLLLSCEHPTGVIWQVLRLGYCSPRLIILAEQYFKQQTQNLANNQYYSARDMVMRQKTSNRAIKNIFAKCLRDILAGYA